MSKNLAKDPDDETMKDFFRMSGVGIKQERKTPAGNKPCPCGSEIRYDLCCGAEIL